jgi:hypothetical protein
MQGLVWGNVGFCLGCRVAETSVTAIQSVVHRTVIKRFTLLFVSLLLLMIIIIMILIIK